MSFIEAIEYLKNNPESGIWLPYMDTDICIKLKGKILYIYSNNIETRQYHICTDDILSDDWEVYQETFDFATAIKKMEEGKKVGRLSNINKEYWYFNDHDILVSNQNKIIDFVGILAIFATDWIEYIE